MSIIEATHSSFSTFGVRFTERIEFPCVEKRDRLIIREHPVAANF
jgi:hypothetical protein